jgi:hypothetical protein
MMARYRKELNLVRTMVRKRVNDANRSNGHEFVEQVMYFRTLSLVA